MPRPIFRLNQSKEFLQVKSRLSSGGVFLRSDAIIVFVCGAQTSKSGPKVARDVFLEYASQHLKKYRFFRAEEVFDPFLEKSDKDLLTLEDALAKYSDCIMLICESESTFAELGAFVIKEDLVKQVLIINSRNFFGVKSFINEGPIKRADKKSTFRPAIYTRLDAILTSAPDIAERLGRIERHNRKKIDLNSKEKSKDMSRYRLMLTADIVRMFSPIKTSELVDILNSIYGNIHTQFELELALLCGLKIIEKNGDWLTNGENNTEFFFFYTPIDQSLLRASIVRYYFRNDRARLSLLK